MVGIIEGLYLCQGGGDPALPTGTQDVNTEKDSPQGSPTQGKPASTPERDQTSASPPTRSPSFSLAATLKAATPSEKPPSSSQAAEVTFLKNFCLIFSYHLPFKHRFVFPAGHSKDCCEEGQYQEYLLRLRPTRPLDQSLGFQQPQPAQS